MDPLSLLREFNVNRQVDRVVLEGDRVHFGDRYEFPKSSFTAFKDTGKGYYYTLETVLFFLKNRHLPTAQYVAVASTQAIPTVHRVDRKQLGEYLDGFVDAQSLPQITAPEFVPIATIPQDADGLEPPLKRPRTQEEEEDDENTALRALLSQERKLRDRNTVLIVPNRDFSQVLQVLETVEMQKRHKQHVHGSRPHQHHTATVPQPPLPPRPSGALPPPPPGQRQPAKRPADMVQQALPIKPSARFERDTANDQLKAMGGDAAVGLSKMLNLYGSAAGGRGQPAYAAAPSSQPSTSRAAVPSHMAQRPPHAGQPKPSGVPSSSRHHSSSESHRDSRKGAIPIILVPAGFTTLINMHNAAQFLEHGNFVTWEAAREQNPIKQSFAVINRTAYRPKPVQYHVTDKVPDKRSPDWQRVVAVIAQGAKWQFKDFPFKGAADGDLVDTFSRICGIYVHYHDEKLPDIVKSWNVKRLAVHRFNRHLDMPALLELYKHLDTFLVANKSQLAY